MGPHVESYIGVGVMVKNSGRYSSSTFSCSHSRRLSSVSKDHESMTLKSESRCSSTNIVLSPRARFGLPCLGADSNIKQSACHSVEKSLTYNIWYAKGLDIQDIVVNICIE